MWCDCLGWFDFVFVEVVFLKVIVWGGEECSLKVGVIGYVSYYVFIGWYVFGFVCLEVLCFGVC